MSKVAIKVLAFFYMISILTTAAEACSMCFKDPHAPSTIALQKSVLFLLGVVFLIFIAFLKFLWSFNRRSKLSAGA